MRYKLFAQDDVKQNSKRQRVVNSRYRGDYIEPTVYRTIMEWWIVSSLHCNTLLFFFFISSGRTTCPPLFFSSSLLPQCQASFLYGWDFKWLMCLESIFLVSSFFFFLTDSVSVVLASPSVPLPQEEAIKELITESVEVNNTGQVPFLYYHIFLHSESVFFL